MESKEVKISIIVPVYNVEKYLDKCVKSLLNQTMPDIEIVLVDDGSPDSCPRMCDHYAETDARVKVIHKPNGGLSSARNAGFEVISGEYFMFVDSDDWLDLDTCEVSYKYASEHSADCLMFSYTKEFESHSVVNHTFEKEYIKWNKQEVSQNLHRRLFGLIGKELARPQDCDLIVSACMQLYKTEKFRDVRFVDTKIIGTEDCWYQIQLYKNCDSFVYIDRSFYHYLKTNESSLTSKHNPHLFQRWQRLYDYMEDFIKENNLSEDYYNALQNRIAISMLGIGLNQVHAKGTIWNGAKYLRSVLSTERYQNALRQLNTSVMPLSWKVFFSLAKHNMTFSLILVLITIEYLRSH